MSDGRFYNLSHQEYLSLIRVRRVLDLLLAANHKMPVMYARAFIEVAMVPLKGPTAYAQNIGVVQPYMSRVLREIGSDPRYRAESTQWVDSMASATSSREKEYYLTAKGLKLMQDMVEIIR